MKRSLLLVTVVLMAALLAPSLPAGAQGPDAPLPADLYILTSTRQVLRIDAERGGQMPVSPDDQPVIDFAIAPDGMWMIYRTQNQDMAIVKQITGGSGFVLEFGAPRPTNLDGHRTIAWSLDGAFVAYVVAGAVRIAALSGGEYGEPVFSTVPGSFTDLAWVDMHALMAWDSMGQYTQITRQADGAWAGEPLANPPRQPMTTAAVLTPEGVQLADGRLVPGTAGALAFDWAPQPPPVAEGMVLPADLLFLSPNAQGIDQVWRAPRDGTSPLALTAASEPVRQVDLSPDGTRLAYATDFELAVIALDGFVVTSFSVEGSGGLAWSADGSRLAYHTQTGLWAIDLTAAAPAPRIVIPNRTSQDNIDGIRYYFGPRWNADGTRLLVGAGLYEGAFPAVIDVATGAVTEFRIGFSGDARWLPDGRVLVWNMAGAYVEPGVFVLDPAAPEAEPQRVVGTDVVPVEIAPYGDGWAILTSATSNMGPAYLRVLTAPALEGPYTLAHPAMQGGFAEQPALYVPPDGSGAFLIAGLGAVERDEQYNASGSLVVIDTASGQTVQIPTPAAVHAVRWAP